VIRSADFWLGLFAAPISLAWILRAAGEINRFGLAILAVDNGFVWAVLIGLALDRTHDESVKTLGPRAALDAATRARDRMRVGSGSGIFGWAGRLWAGWRALRLDRHRPLAQCRVDTLAEDTAACVVDLAGTVLPIGLPASVLRRAGLKEGDRFRWRI